MRNDPSAIFFQFEVSPEAIMAQRLQELKDLAEYKERHLCAYKAWVEPKAIKERVEALEKDAPKALERAKLLSESVMEGWTHNKTLAAEGLRPAVASLKNIRVKEK